MENKHGATFRAPKELRAKMGPSASPRFWH